MNTTAKNVAPVANSAGVKPKRTRKAKHSAKRALAEQAYANAKSDQEKTVARSAVKIARFEDLARARVRRVIRALGGVAKLANRAAYTWTEEQSKKILDAVVNETNTLINKFAGQKADKPEFDL